MQRAGEFNIKLEDVSITHLTFGKVSLLVTEPSSLRLTYDFRNSPKPLKQNKLLSKVLPHPTTDYQSTYLSKHFTDAERAKFIVEKAEQERQAAVIRAEGEAEAAATISRSLEKAGEAFVAFRKIEASKAIVQSLVNNPNVTYIPSGGGNVLLNIPTKR